MLCGARVIADTAEAGWRRAAANRWWELETDLFLASYLRRGDSVLDVGGNEGVLAVLAAIFVGDEGSVHVFEPDSRLAAISRDAARRNGLSNVIVNEMAVADHERCVPFAKDFSAEYAKMALSSDASTDIPATTLDSYCAREGLPTVSVLIADVDGPELRVLQGASQLLSSTAPPVVVVEASNETLRLGYEPMQIVAYLESLGYACFASRMKFARVKRIRRHEDFASLPVRFDANEVANLFCFRPDSHLERLATSIWPRGAVPPSYYRH